jgi:hypothetical protein
MSSNQTLHFEARFDDGETIREKCRDSLGGHINMMKRLETRCGGRVRCVLKCETDGGWMVGGQLVEGWDTLPRGEVWVEGGRRFELVQLVKVGPGLWAEA